MSDIADKIYAATGLTLNAEAAAKVGHMIRLARQAALEEAARMAEGKVYKELYRTWPWWLNRDGSQGNASNERDLVQHADKIAAAIRALGEKE